MQVNYFDITHQNFSGLLQNMAQHFGVKIKDNMIVIPSIYGSGYVRVINFKESFSLMIAELKLNHDLFFKSEATRHQFFTLSLNEVVIDDLNSNEDYHKESRVHLKSSLMTWQFHIPKEKSVKTIKINFEKKHLLDFMDSGLADEFFTAYFSHYLQNHTTPPINKDYRTLMHDLINAAAGMPFKNHIIYNRILLLFETFMVRNYDQDMELKSKLNDEEISRLMKAEAQLIKDFSLPAPTIEVLSRLCAMSATKLKKDFKQLYGFPIYEYFQKNRMAKAKMLLQTGEYSIKEVGIMVGYSNLSHFASAFRKEFGLLPSELINSNNNNQMFENQS